MFSIFFDQSEKQLEKARSDFEYARDLEGDSREKRAVRVRMAMRCKLVLDKIFIEAAQMEAVFQEESMIAAAAGEAAPQKLEETAKESICYQVIKSLNGLVISYVPQPYAGEMADLGVKFEKGIINARQAIELSQKIADRLADELKMDLYLIQPIEPLSFMREKLDELDAMRQGSSGASEAGSAAGPVDSFKANTSNTEKPPPIEKAIKKKQNEAPPEDNYSWD
ncbi:MAG: hypothetical protein ACO326_08360 [Burkholderiaceae bacterium]